MKKIWIIPLVALMVFAFAACGGSQEESSSTDTEETAAAQETDDTAAGGDAIVVYFSASGNTKRVAEIAADETGAELFELTPKNPYSEKDLDWTDSSSRVNSEHENASLQDIALKTTDVPDWDKYSTVFIGYPIWWGEAAWPVNNFIKSNDFTGKTVFPFCTSSTSDLGDSGELLAEMAGTGQWQEGERFPEQADESKIREWVQGLDLE